jgi:HEAT repeat protein
MLNRIDDKMPELIQGLVKTVKAYQMYGLNHPSFRNFYKPYYEKLNGFLDEYGLLDLQIEKFTILSSGQIVYQESEKELSIAFKLFRDGIRNINFMEGLTPDELLHFVETIGQTSKDQDLALSLWESNFSHLTFYVVEEEEETIGYQIPDPQYYDIDYDARIKDILGQERIDLRTVIDPDLNDKELAEVNAEISEEKMVQIAPAITTLISFLDYEKSPEIIDSLGELLEQCINQRDFFNARRIVQKMNDFPEIKIVSKFENEKTILGFVDLPETLDDQAFNDFTAFLGFFSPDSIPFLVRMSARVKRKDRRDSLRQRIAHLAQNDPTPILPFLTVGDTPVLINAISILGLMRIKTIAKDFEPLYQHLDPGVRIALIEALFNIKEPAIILRFLDDLDQGVRINTLQALTALQYQRIFNRIVKRLRDKDFLTLDIAEQKEYINCLVGVGDPTRTARLLEKILFKWVLFGAKKYRIMRKLSAQGLAQLPEESAQRALTLGCQRKNKDIRQSCEMALRNR